MVRGGLMKAPEKGRTREGRTRVEGGRRIVEAVAGIAGEGIDCSGGIAAAVAVALDDIAVVEGRATVRIAAAGEKRIAVVVGKARRPGLGGLASQSRNSLRLTFWRA